MKWNKFESCLLLVTCCFSLASSQVASESIEEEVCNTNHFRASCADDEVIIVETAQYGRYQLGTCILEGFGYLGCMHDVMLEAESYCSGRRKCEIRVDDTSFPRAAPCHKDLKNHLWISYRCYKVVAPKSHCHPNGNPETVVDLTKLGAPGSGSSRAASARIHGNEDDSDLDGVEEASRPRDAGAYRRERGTSGHLLSSWITEQTGCGTADSPWVVVAGEGQRLNLTLYDFGPEAATPLVGGRADRGRGRHHEPSFDAGPPSFDGGGRSQANRSVDQHVKPTCRVLATVRESPQFRSNTICSGQGRVVNVATSLTNRVELRFLVGRSKGSASTRSGDKGETSAAGGATDDGQQQQQLPADRTKYQLPSHFLFQIKVIGCATPPVLKGTRVNRIGDHVTIDCGSDSGESWQMTCVDGSWTGYYRNCSQDSTSLHSRLEGIMPYATSIVIVGIIAVLMVCFILTAGIFCIKWRLRQDLSRSRYFRPKPSASRDAEYIGYPTGGQQQQQHQQQHLADDRKYPLIPGGAHIGSYYPVMASGSDNLNEYATMRLLQQNEQLMRAGGLARSAAVEPGVSSANVLVVAENYRYPPPPPPQLPQPSIAISSSSSSASKTGAMASFLAASESPQFFGYRSDHVYECPDLVRQEVSRIAAAASCVPASCVQSRDQLAAPTKVECSAVADSSNRNFSL